jgi:hypothetical protein
MKKVAVFFLLFVVAESACMDSGPMGIRHKSDILPDKPLANNGVFERTVLPTIFEEEEGSEEYSELKKRSNDVSKKKKIVIRGRQARK